MSPLMGRTMMGTDSNLRALRTMATNCWRSKRQRVMTIALMEMRAGCKFWIMRRCWMHHGKWKRDVLGKSNKSNSPINNPSKAKELAAFTHRRSLIGRRRGYGILSLSSISRTPPAIIVAYCWTAWGLEMYRCPRSIANECKN